MDNNIIVNAIVPVKSRSPIKLYWGTTHYQYMRNIRHVFSNREGIDVQLCEDRNGYNINTSPPDEYGNTFYCSKCKHILDILKLDLGK